MFKHLHTKLLFLNCIMFISTAVISEPDDVTVCEGRSTTFTCVLDSSISSDDVQWHRLLRDTGTTETIGTQLEGFTVHLLPGMGNFTTTLNITNARESYTGYYWVRLPSDVCNVSLTVSAGTYVFYMLHIMFYNMPIFSNIVPVVILKGQCVGIVYSSEAV